MPDIFADTAEWGHLVDATQAYHHRAATIYRGARQQERTFITTNYILMELVALLMSPLRIPHTQIVAFITGLKTSPYVDIVHVDLTLDAQAWRLFTERPDKEWSLVDCASFVVMQQYGLRKDRPLAVEAAPVHGYVAVGQKLGFDDGFEGSFAMPLAHTFAPSARPSGCGVRETAVKRSLGDALLYAAVTIARTRRHFL